jgi:hypothetical protein
VEKTEGKRPLGRPRRRWDDNIKMNQKEREDGVEWTGLIWFRMRPVEGSCEHGYASSSFIGNS